MKIGGKDLKEYISYNFESACDSLRGWQCELFRDGDTWRITQRHWIGSNIGPVLAHPLQVS
jgi:hypothetical protein